MIDFRELQETDFCLLCGSPPVLVGIFIPNDPVAWGGLPGKRRMLRYCLCQKCCERTEREDAVEKMIAFSLGVERCQTHC